jgi:hypothetical protein
MKMNNRIGGWVYGMAMCWTDKLVLKEGAQSFDRHETLVAVRYM